MCEFARTWVLALLPLGPLLAWLWLRRRERAIPFSCAAVFDSLPHGKAPTVRWVGSVARASALCLVIIALAGPRWPDPGSRIRANGIAIQVVLDVSGSMAERDFDWEGRRITRLDAAKKTFHAFVTGSGGPTPSLPGRTGDLVGLVAFATWPETTCPLTLSHSALLHLLDMENSRTLPTESQTNVGDALAWGLRGLARSSSARKVMILLTDGEHNVPPPALTPMQAAQLAANLGIPIYVIDTWKDARSPHNIATDTRVQEIRNQAKRTLENVAHLTGGKYLQAGNTPALLAAGHAIDQAEKSSTQSFIYRRYFEAFPWITLSAFTLLVGVHLLEKTLWLPFPP